MRVPAAYLWTAAVILPLFAWHAEEAATAQTVPALLEVPVSVRSQYPELQQRRAQISSDRDQLKRRLSEHNKRCDAVELNSAMDSACTSAQASLGEELQRHVAASNTFNAAVRALQYNKRDDETRNRCEIAKRRAEAARTAVERIRSAAAANQQELSDWKKMNDEAQKAAIWAAVQFALERYTADIAQVGEATKKAEVKAAALMEQYAAAYKSGARQRYLALLRNAIAEATPLRISLFSKGMVETASDANQAWAVARNTMNHEFRVAMHHDERLKEVLQDPGFRDAFIGDPNAEPGMDVLTILWDQAVSDTAKALTTATRYESLAVPAVSAGIFVREEAYEALKSLLSTERVGQATSVAGDLAKASGILQREYQAIIDEVRMCTTR